MFIVTAHYAPIPAKLAMILEKVEQIAFLPRFHDDTHRSPLYKKPAGLIAHGGGTDDLIKHYKSVVLDTIKNALAYPVEMDVVGVNVEWPNGIAFPVKKVLKEKESLFPIQEYDWDDIKYRISPLVENLLKRLNLESKF